MKRLPQTLTAAALTGALAFGGAAVAQAQMPLPASIETDGITYDKQADGSYAPRDRFENPAGENSVPTLTEDQARAIWERQQSEDGENTDSETPGTEADTEGAADAEGTDSEGSEEEGIPAPATKKDAEGNEWYQSLKDKTIYVNDPALVNEEITDEMRDAYAKAFPSEDPKPGFDKKKLAWLALPAALVIGGITWYLSQDGKTYVKDEARKGQEPTAEEKSASEQMLNSNKDEVVAQGGKLAEGDAAQADAPTAPAAGEGTDSVRGMAAETGSNSVAQALAALAVAAMVAAGAFAARRKFFA
ncbi:hypothetical protein [Corynebacterium tuberculostearicum]|uniref:hypothetical protein n=1 Tax=Corynebacterium tuberculostearicum TaxID=38304 RepID=UPI002025C0BA|nr:hypothetical protein [Corynebacterium tuberculostearicum]MCG7463977.1 hypothetical protein [Corynebacterium tuberculostearicum]